MPLLENPSLLMPNFNKIFLIGNLTRDPENRSTTGGKTLTTFCIATNHTFTALDGKVGERVCFVDVVTWGTLARTCAGWLKKGKLVFIEGRLEKSTWEKDSKTHSKLQVHATTVLFLSPPDKTNDSDPTQETPTPAKAHQKEADTS